MLYLKIYQEEELEIVKCKDTYVQSIETFYYLNLEKIKEEKKKSAKKVHRDIFPFYCWYCSQELERISYC